MSIFDSLYFTILFHLIFMSVNTSDSHSVVHGYKCMMNFFHIFKQRQLRDIDYNRYLVISLIVLGIGLLIALLIGPEITQCVVKYVSYISKALLFQKQFLT